MDQHHEPAWIEKIANKLKDLLNQYYGSSDEKPVVSVGDFERLKSILGSNQPPERGEDFDQVLIRFERDILVHSVQTWHPLFLNQMFSGVPLPGVVGDMLASMMNPTLATWEMSPAATIVEQSITRWMAHTLGMTSGSGGILLPGGSLSNLLALTLARNTRLSTAIRPQGLAGAPQGAIICSDMSHYSIASAANLLGIGTQHVMRVKTNARGEMDPDDARQQVDQCLNRGWKPFCLIATLGTTVTGGFDPLPQLATLCQQHAMHLHADAAFGGGMAFSPHRDKLFHGIQFADSVTWDAHKAMYVPLTCSALLVPEVRLLEQTFSQSADYLFHDRESTPVNDLGKRTFLCGKRFDGLKIWMLWKTWGSEGFRRLCEARMQLVQNILDFFEANPEFIPVYDPVSPIVCFRYQPEFAMTDSESDRMHEWIRETCLRRGTAFFNVVNLHGRSCFRLVLINPLTTMADIEKLCTEIQNLAREFIASTKD